MSKYIGFETLQMKCTRYEICGQVAFKNARTIVFQNWAGMQQFSVGYIKSKFSEGAAAPTQLFHAWKVCGGGGT